jgi:hypothetical protein
MHYDEVLLAELFLLAETRRPPIGARAKGFEAPITILHANLTAELLAEPAFKRARGADEVLLSQPQLLFIAHVCAYALIWLHLRDECAKARYAVRLRFIA